MNAVEKVLIIVVILIVVVGGAWFFQSRSTPATVPVSAVQTTDYKNATYTIDGQSVTLVNGSAEVAAAPGSASKIVTTYFGNDATGDLNDDGIPDAAFILTQDSGGSGTFYYVVAALKTGTGYKGTNAVLLGDRIAPQSTQIQNGEIIVNYADRAPGEPMTTAPSVGESMHLKVNGTTLAQQHLNADAYPLYSGLSWVAEQQSTLENLSGYEAISAPITNITDLSAVSTPFDAYYKNKLETSGWAVDNALAAGGPGDSITGYKKGNEYILVSYTTKFHAGGVNEPEQCPCDISFSVFSGSRILK